MRLPAFITEFDGLWLLTEDTHIHACIRECGRLNWDNVFEQVLDRVWHRHGTMIDVGAFVGDTTAWFRGFFKCITFEPQRDAFACLVHNIPGAVHFPFPAGNGEKVDLEIVGNIEGNPGARGVQIGTQCQTIRIDDLGLTDVALIKIDAEGWEPHVLEGAKETISKCRPVVVAEINLGPLKARGFTAEDIEKHFQDWEKVVIYRYLEEQWDTMFIPKPV